jgi:phosphonate transport system substrate-binding protein
VVVVGLGSVDSVHARRGPQRVYTLAVVPQFEPAVVESRWGPLLDRIAADTGVRLDLTVYRSIPDFETAFRNAVPDFAYMNPYHAVMARAAQGYIPLVRDGSQPLVGILVVRRDSPAEGIADLDGSTLAFPSPNAFAASLYMRALLAKEHHLRFTSKYVGTHSNVYRHVFLGKAAAGGGVNKTLASEPAELRDSLRVIFETPAVAAHPISVHPRVPSEVQRAVQEGIIALAADPSGRRILGQLELSEPVAADFARDYQALERLGLEQYVAD